jgi:hypothetical protein
VAQPDLADGARWPQLAGDGHHDEVWPFEVVGAAGDDHGRPLFDGGLVREWEWHQDDRAKREGLGR